MLAFRPFALAVALLVLPTSEAHAQLSAYAEAGAALPTGSFAEIASGGPRFAVGLVRGADASGAVFGADVSYARAAHTVGDARSELIGLTAWAGYSIAADPVTVTPLAGLGALSHARRSQDFPGLDSTRAGVAVRLALRVSAPLGRLRVFAAGGYEKGLGSLAGAAFPTEFGTASAGVALSIGG